MHSLALAVTLVGLVFAALVVAVLIGRRGLGAALRRHVRLQSDGALLDYSGVQGGDLVLSAHAVSQHLREVRLAEKRQEMD
jgi:hypothetical protein